MSRAIGFSGFDVAVQNSVSSAFARLAWVSARVATGRRILSGRDDPAGLIAVGQLANDLAAWQKASEATGRASSAVHVADHTLALASDLIADAHANAVAAASDTTSPKERAALQQQVDSAIQAVTRLGDATWAGQHVLGRELKFLVGPDPSDTATLHLPAVDEQLGGASGTLADVLSGGDASLEADPERAAQILEQAQAQLSSARAEAGTFERTVLDTSQRVSDDMQAILARDLSLIQDAEFASESALLVRSTIMAETAISVAQLTHHAWRMTNRLFDRLFDVVR